MALFRTLLAELTNGYIPTPPVPTPEPPTPPLPSEYQEVEYIENTYRSFINTGLTNIGANQVRYEFKVSVNLAAQRALFGSYSNNSNQGTIWFHGSNSADMWFRNNDQIATDIFAPDYPNPLALEGYMEINGANWSYDFNNGKYSKSGNNINTSLAYPSTSLYLFTQNGDGTQAANEKIYYFKIYNDSNGTYELKRNFIPCYRKSDNVIGMYDTVEQIFYTNAGTGTFTKGPDV